MYELLLVSQSPRRKQLLENAGFLFRVDTVKISENIGENVNVAEAIVTLARTKGEVYLSSHNSLKGRDILLLSADTMVVHRGRALGKPKNSTEAQQFLGLLSGQTHEVITGIFIKNLKSDEYYSGFDTTKVEFRKLSATEIREYVDGGEPMDKAGAYAIQGDGGRFVQTIHGSKSNVIGLPLELLENVLKEKSWNVARHIGHRESN
jgi:septum formation protein